MLKIWLVVLRLATLSVLEKIEKARFIVLSMTGNAFFTTPEPPLADVTAAANALETASVKAEGGNRGDIAAMHAKEDILNRLLHAEGNYVEDTANADAVNGAEIILSAGMEFRNTGRHTVTEFSASNTKVSGEVKLQRKSAGRASYIWEYAVAGEEPRWLAGGTTLKSTTNISGLTPATKYLFRVAIVTSEGQEGFSEPIMLVVT